MSRFLSLSLVAVAAVALAACDATSTTDAPLTAEARGSRAASPGSFNADGAGAVFALSDADGPNEVVAFARDRQGALAEAGRFETGGSGSSGGLGASTDPLVLSPDGRFLYAVNRGSDDVSIFQVTGNRLKLRGVVASGGAAPISIAVSDDLLYVLNTGRDGAGGTVAAFERRPNGRLDALGAVALPDFVGGPVQVGFDPATSTAVVTDRPSNTILSYPVQADGTPGEPTVTASAGPTPFGFDFDAQGRLFVSEANGGAPDASFLTSYAANGTALSVIEASVNTTETAACWARVSGRYVYTTNTGSGTITGFEILADGSLEILDADGVTATTGSAPRDLNVAGSYLYAQSDGQIDAFRIGEGGALTPIGTVEVPATARGVASR